MDINNISKTSQNGIPDAEYYLVRPKNSDMIYIMEDKPDYKHEPFYVKCAGCILDLRNHLTEHAIGSLDTSQISCEEDGYLYTLGLCPSKNSVASVSSKSHFTIGEILSNDTYAADNEVAKHYELFNWHIPMLLKCEPFKKYIQEHLDEFKVEESKAPSTPGPTKESKGTPVILNKRLLI